MYETRQPELELTAPAKINLALEVTSRRPDGFHNLVTIFQSLELHDTLTIGPSNSMRVSCSHPELTDRRNLAWAAAELLAKRFGDESLRAHLVVDKRIPIAGGLGGGSSDAAAALVGLSRLWRGVPDVSESGNYPKDTNSGKNRTVKTEGLDAREDVESHLVVSDSSQDKTRSEEDLIGLARGLGADVAFFLLGGTVLGTGRGDELRALRPLPRRGVVLIVPPVDFVDRKTPRMFQSLGAEDFSDGTRSLAAVSEIESGRWPVDDLLVNAFDRVADDVFPGIRAVRDRIEDVLGLPARLTGSGPTLFALVDDPWWAAEQLTRTGLVAIPTFASELRAGFRPPREQRLESEGVI